MLMWLFNPGDKVCDHFNIRDDLRIVTRLFINMHWYGHHAVWAAIWYARQFPPMYTAATGVIYGHIHKGHRPQGHLRGA